MAFLSNHELFLHRKSSREISCREFVSESEQMENVAGDRIVLDRVHQKSSVAFHLKMGLKLKIKKFYIRLFVCSDGTEDDLDESLSLERAEADSTDHPNV